MGRLTQWSLVIAGAASFVTAHLVLSAAWPAFDPDGAHRAWFLNSGRAVAFAAAWLAATGWLLGPRRIRGSAAPPRSPAPDVIGRAAAIAGGAALAMIAVLFAVGPGTLFPIAIVIGGCVVSAAVFGGALVGARLGNR